MSQIDIERDLDRHEMIRDTRANSRIAKSAPWPPNSMKAERFPADIYEAMAKLGMFGSPSRTNWAAPAPTRFLRYVMEELSRGYASIADQCGLVELIGTLLTEHGTPEQQQHYLRPLLQAKRRCAYCITEAEAGSDVSGIKTTATQRRTAGVSPAQALDPQRAGRRFSPSYFGAHAPELGKRGMSIFIVDRDQPGYRIGRHEHKMGKRASQVGALHFDDIKLPKTALLVRSIAAST